MKKTLFLASLLVAALSATQVYAGTAITVTSTTHTLTAEQLTSASGFSNDDVTYTYDTNTKLGILTGSGVIYNDVNFTVSDSALSSTTTETNMIYVYTGTNSYGISVGSGGTIRGAWGQQKAVPSTWGSNGKAHSDYASYVSDGSLSLKATFNKDNGTKLTAVAAGKEDLELYNVSGLRGGAGTSLRINTDYVQTLDYNHYDFSYTDATGTHDITGAAMNVISSTDVPATIIYKNRLEMNATGTANMSAHGGDIYVAAGGQAYVTGGTLSNNLFVGGSDHYVEGGSYDGDIRLEGGATISGTVTLLDNTIMASASRGGTFSGTVAGDGKKLTINQGHAAGTLNFTGSVTLGEMASANAVAFNNASGSFAVDKLNNSNTTTVAANTTLTIKELAGTGAVTNNGIVNLNVNAESTTYVRTENGYNGTQKVVTLGGSGALSGTGTWKVDNIQATLDNRTLTAVDFDYTKYYVDVDDASYVASLQGKYVISANKKLTISDYQENAKVQQNNGTIVLSGMSGYFAKDTALGNVELSGDNALNLTNGYTPDSGKATKIANLSGSGTITISGDHNPKERFEVTGNVSSSVSFDAKRGWVGSDTTFAFTKADVDNVSIGDVTNTTATLNFEAKALTVTSLTLNSGTVGVYGIGTQHTEANEVTLTTSALTVNGNANLNADLVMAGNGTMDFSTGHVLTMGSTVTIGEGVKVYITGSADDIRYGQEVTIMESVENALTLNNALIFVNGVQQNDFSLKLTDDHRIVVAPEPATATLSLLALAALASRRRRH